MCTPRIWLLNKKSKVIEHLLIFWSILYAELCHISLSFQTYRTMEGGQHYPNFTADGTGSQNGSEFSPKITASR